MARRKSSIPKNGVRRSSRLIANGTTPSTSTSASKRASRSSNVKRRSTMNTSQQEEQKREFKRSLLTDDEQENIRPEKKEVKKRPRRSGDAGLLAGMKTDEEDDDVICLDPLPRMKDEPLPSMEAEDEDGDVGEVPMDYGVVPKNELIKKERRDNSPPRVDGVNDGRVIGRPLDANKRYEVERKSCIIYPYPRHTLFGNAKRNSFGLTQKSMGKRMLDLMIDGEVDGGGDLDKEGNYVIDGVLFMDKEAALVNWQNYKYPTWLHKRFVKSKDVDYFKRRKTLDKVFIDMNLTENISPMELNRLYPNMTVIQTEDFSQYVTNPGILYLSGLLKREQQINEYIDEYYMQHFKTKGPTILFVDATDFKESSIPTFQYIVEVEETEEAKEIIGSAMANKKTCKCGPSCNFRSSCCAFKSDSRLAYVKKNTIGNATIVGEMTDDDFSDDGRGSEKSYDCVDHYECGDECSCTPTTCQQRVIQRGNGHTFMIFRHHLKGWTVRAGNDISQGNFVCEYTGQIMTEGEARRVDKMYHLGLDVRMKDRKKSHLIIDANKKGNEGRFFAHSCEPNLFLLRVHFDIDGRPKRHVALFANRNIKEGEELTFDYFADVIDFEAFHVKTKLLKFTCRCGTKKCRETAYQKKKRQSMM